MSAEKRKKLIEEASQYVTKDRNAAYGEPEDNFSRIAEIWSAQGVSIDGRPLNASDVALMMAGMKLARLRTNPNHRDSWVDLIGYAACGGDVALVEEAADRYMNGATVDGMFIKREDLAEAEVKIDALIRGMSEPQPVPVYGWQSHNRCGDAQPSENRMGTHAHSPHSFGSGRGLWCDGYKAKPLTMVHNESDLDVIKRVAEKTMRKMSDRSVSPFPTRPIRDNPQA